MIQGAAVTQFRSKPLMPHGTECIALHNGTLPSLVCVREFGKLLCSEPNIPWHPCAWGQIAQHHALPVVVKPILPRVMEQHAFKITQAVIELPSHNSPLSFAIILDDVCTRSRAAGKASICCGFNLCEFNIILQTFIT